MCLVFHLDVLLFVLGSSNKHLISFVWHWVVFCFRFEECYWQANWEALDYFHFSG